MDEKTNPVLEYYKYRACREGWGDGKVRKRSPGDKIVTLIKRIMNKMKG